MTMAANLEQMAASDAHELSIMDGSGDSKITWTAGDEIAIENARRSFAYFQEQGYTAFRVDGPDGGIGEPMTEFDPSAEQVVFIPPMQAG